MFRKYPYRGWLILAILLWGMAGLSDSVRHKSQSPATIMAAVKKDLWAKDARFQAFLRDTATVNRLLDNNVSDSLFKVLAQEPFYIFAYRGQDLLSWNDDDILPQADSLVTDTAGRLVFQNNQYCIRKSVCFKKPGQPPGALVILFPVAHSYPFENEYLHSSINAVREWPEDFEIVVPPAMGKYLITDASGKQVWFSANMSPPDPDNILPDNRTVILLILAVFISGLWIQLLILRVTRQHKQRTGLLLTALLLLSVRAAVYFLPLPFHLKELKIFSPDIYAASWLLQSLGDLLLNEVCLIWLLVFIIMETDYARLLKGVKHSGGQCVLAGVLFIVLLFFNNAAWNILHGLVIDSQIVFDVSHLHSIDLYSIIGLLSIAIGFLIAEMMVRIINAQLNIFFSRKWLKLLIILVAGSAMIVWQQPGHPSVYINIIWLTGYIALIDLNRTRTFSDILSLSMIFVSVFTCACVTVKLHYLIKARDVEKDRISYASHLLIQQDPEMEYNFKSVAEHIKKDIHVSVFLKAPDREKETALIKRINILHLDVLLNRYQPEYYFFDSVQRPLFNPDTLSFATLSQKYEEGMPTLDDHLVFIEDGEVSYYLSKIGFGSGYAAGTLFLFIKTRKNVNETVYPELLQPATVSRIDKEAKYAYALYTNGRLLTQTSDYTFPQTFSNVKSPYQKIIRTEDGIDELYYQESAGKSVIIAGSSASWLSTGVLMSYLFGLHLLLSLIAIAYRWIFRLILRDYKKNYHFTLRSRIHFSMQSIVLVSFFIVGIVTVIFFNIRFHKASQNNEHQVTQTVSRFIHQYLSAQNGLDNISAMDSVTQTQEFQYALANLVNNQKTDASLFSTSGQLLIATQAEIYNQGLMAPVMHPQAFRSLKSGKKSIVEVEEHVGKFQYLSCYMSLKNDDGMTLGYISVPFFSSKRELNDQISNIIIALINIYALLFMLSSMLALFITSRITRTFNLMIGKFGRLSLQQNELIEWPYKDEIGVLVKEYNNMVRKVEENAALLAQSEREGAWREMAKQVAHEIKNPLTPMKLNIQYLQNALKNNHPNVAGLAARVSSSIIEQIDNLSYIASEFSNFAKMPAAHPEAVELNDMLEKAVALHQNRQGIEVILKAPAEQLFIIADRSQLLRVFTNLLQNAVQAIPVDERAGIIEVILTGAGDHTIIEIKDNGIGISDDAAMRIFKPYFTTKSSGTGLGLAMTRKIIELWKGSIWFESQQGTGTSFFIRLPLAANDDTTAQP